MFKVKDMIFYAVIGKGMDDRMHSYTLLFENLTFVIKITVPCSNSLTWDGFIFNYFSLNGLSVVLFEKIDECRNDNRIHDIDENNSYYR